MNISVVILTKNEEGNIGECIRGLTFCEEVIVIDDNSRDKTIEIARGLGAKVFQRNLNGNFSAQRNFGMEKATGKWVLFIDADERISRQLKDEIGQEVSVLNNPYLGYFVKRDDYIFGKKLNYGETASVRLLRLARKSAGNLWARNVHEVWDVRGRTKTLKNSLRHYPHQTLREFIKDINFQSDLHAEANYKEGKSSNLARIVFWPRGKFFYNYFLRLGFLDGTEGFVFALIMSFHSFLSWSKLWIIQRKR